MRSSNNVTISLPKDYIQKLESLKEDGETIGLCMKRLLIGLLDGVALPETPPHHIEEQVNKLQQQLMNLEELVTTSVSAASPAAVDNPQLEKRLDQLEAHFNTMNVGYRVWHSKLEERVNALEQRNGENTEKYPEENRLRRIESGFDGLRQEVFTQLAIAQKDIGHVEADVSELIVTAKDKGWDVSNIYSKKSPPPNLYSKSEPERHQSDLETKAKTEGLTCAELAKLTGKNPSTVSRWKDRESGCSPTGGYRWSTSKSLWFATI